VLKGFGGEKVEGLRKRIAYCGRTIAVMSAMGQKQTSGTSVRDVCFTPESGHQSTQAEMSAFSHKRTFNARPFPIRNARSLSYRQADRLAGIEPLQHLRVLDDDRAVDDHIRDARRGQRVLALVEG
jgi:hypothetical protein